MVSWKGIPPIVPCALPYMILWFNEPPVFTWKKKATCFRHSPKIVICWTIRRSFQMLPHLRVFHWKTTIPYPFHSKRSEEHTSELRSLMRTSYAVFCLTKKKNYIYRSIHTEYFRT